MMFFFSWGKVVIGGRNKYLINGVNANNTRVQDLFCSVGLNVNNPHFLIMQVSSVYAIYASNKDLKNILCHIMFLFFF